MLIYLDKLTHVYISCTVDNDPTTCGPGGNKNCKNSLPTYYNNNFSMHGLWPATTNGLTLLQMDENAELVMTYVINIYVNSYFQIVYFCT